MKIVTTCYSCGRETTIETPRWVRTVVDFEMEKKLAFFHKCDHCRKNNKTNVNQVHAKKDIIGFLVFVFSYTSIVLILAWLLKSYIPLIALLLLPLLWGEEKDKVKNFNKSLEQVKTRKIKNI